MTNHVNINYHITELEIKEKILNLLPLDDTTIKTVLFDRNQILKSDIYSFLYRYTASINISQLREQYPENDPLEMIANYSKILSNQLISLTQNNYTFEEQQLLEKYLYYTLIQQAQFNNTDYLKTLIIDIFNSILPFDKEEQNTCIWNCKEELRQIILVYYNRYLFNNGKTKDLPFNILEQLEIVKNNIPLVQQFLTNYIIKDYI